MVDNTPREYLSKRPKYAFHICEYWIEERDGVTWYHSPNEVTMIRANWNPSVDRNDPEQNRLFDMFFNELKVRVTGSLVNFVNPIFVFNTLIEVCSQNQLKELERLAALEKVSGLEELKEKSRRQIQSEELVKESFNKLVRFYQQHAPGISSIESVYNLSVDEVENS